MDGLTRMLREVADKAMRASSQEQGVTVEGLRYVREQLETIYARHTSAPPEYERVRQNMVGAIDALYRCLEDLEEAILSGDPELVEVSLKQAEQAARLFHEVEGMVETLEGGTSEGLL